jgi:hypothetical protein
MALFKRFIPPEVIKSQDIPTATPATPATPAEGLPQMGYEIADVTETPRPGVAGSHLISMKERAAILESEGALSLDETEHKTRLSLPLAGWHREIAARGDFARADVERLQMVSLAFLQTRHALEAVQLGWNDLDLFGVFDGPLPMAKGRLEVRGLIPVLAWAPWQPLALETVGADFATVVTPAGSALRHRRRRPARDLAVAWWRSTYLSNA